MSVSEQPLAFYVHLPWCVQKCPYCDFNSHGLRGELPEARYLEALLGDIAEEASRAPGRRVASVFIGGGTPSLFSADAVGRILAAIDHHCGLGAEAEITLEANPGTAEAARFAGYRAVGVNRLSIGVQSLDDERLARLGRIHSAQEAAGAFAMARDAGFDNVNLDLMFGLPDQSVDAALAELQAAVDMAPEHLSWYQLTLEPNTRFAAEPPTGLPDDDALAEMQDCGVELLEQAGFARYEVSAYATPKRQCRHNLNYWRFGDYLAVGAGAHGKLTLDTGEIERRWKHRHPNTFLGSALKTAEASRIAPAQLPFEFMLNALRLTRGVEAELYPLATAQPITQLDTVWRTLVARGLVEPQSSGRLCCTPLGYRWLNDVVAAFLPE